MIKMHKHEDWRYIQSVECSTFSVKQKKSFLDKPRKLVSIDRILVYAKRKQGKPEISMV